MPSESEKVVVEQLFQRDAVIRQSQVANTHTKERVTVMRVCRLSRI